MPTTPATTVLPMTWVDAFTATPFGGNQCVVVFGADHVDDAMRTAFTRETGLSECAFLQASAVADVGVRYHTASGEIPMAGHPTIATVTAMLDRGMVSLVAGRAAFTLEVGAGVLDIEVDATGDGAPLVTMRQLRPTFGGTWDPADIAPLVGLDPADFRARPQTVSTGTAFLVCPLTGHDALRRASLDVAALLAFHDRHDTDFFEPFLTAMGGATADGDVFSRLLLTPPEPPEDPFTGSATGCMAAWLWANGNLVDRTFVAEQGHDMGRPGRAEVTVEGPPDDIEAVRVAGRGVVVMRGEVALAVDPSTPGTPPGATSPGATSPGDGLAAVPAIRSAPSGVAAYIGETEKNLDIGSMRVTSFAEFVGTFGRADGGTAMATAVEQFFTNGGQTAVIAPAKADPRAHAHARSEIADTAADLLVLPTDGGADLPRRLVDDAIAWAEGVGVLVLLDPMAAWTTPAAVPAGPLPTSAAAAMWFPRGIDDHGEPVCLTGAIAGVVARFDRRHGVWKAPAGLEARIRGATPAVPLGSDHLDDLTAVNVNGLRTVGGSLVVWGARTSSLDPEWRYVPVRRTASWIERSIATSLDGQVPGRIDDGVMARVHGRVTDFMMTTFRSGALSGSRPDAAFFVRCDRTTTTPADIDQGRMVVQLGFAPLRPAEFVVVTIAVHTADAADV